MKLVCTDAGSLIEDLSRDTTRVVVLIRHSASVQDGSDETRTLTEKGEMLAAACRPAYTELIKALEWEFSGTALYGTSFFPRAELTLFLATRA